VRRGAAGDELQHLPFGDAVGGGPGAPVPFDDGGAVHEDAVEVEEDGAGRDGPRGFGGGAVGVGDPAGPGEVEAAVRAGLRGEPGGLAVVPARQVGVEEGGAAGGAEQPQQPLGEEPAVAGDDGLGLGGGADPGEGAGEPGRGLVEALPAGEAGGGAAGPPVGDHLVVDGPARRVGVAVEFADVELAQVLQDRHGRPRGGEQPGGVHGAAQRGGPVAAGGAVAQQGAGGGGLPGAAFGEAVVGLPAGEDVVDVGRVLPVADQEQCGHGRSSRESGRGHGGAPARVAGPVRCPARPARRRCRSGRGRGAGSRPPPGRAPRTGSGRWPARPGRAGGRSPRGCAS
jgi:hypothetical protein